MTQSSSYAAPRSFLGSRRAGTRVTTVQRHQMDLSDFMMTPKPNQATNCDSAYFRCDLLTRETGNVAP